MNRRKTTEQVIQNLIGRVRRLEAEAHSHPGPEENLKRQVDAELAHTGSIAARLAVSKHAAEDTQSELTKVRIQLADVVGSRDSWQTSAFRVQNKLAAVQAELTAVKAELTRLREQHPWTETMREMKCWNDEFCGRADWYRSEVELHKAYNAISPSDLPASKEEKP